MTASGPVVVTGAGGFVGRHVVRALLDAGYLVRGLYRRDRAALPSGGDVFHYEGLADRPALRAALSGALDVVHLAGRAHLFGRDAATELASFRAVNVDGTRVVFEESAAAGVRCFVFASSVGAVASQSNTTLTEGTPPAPRNPYGISKLEAEQVVREVGSNSAMRATILRLPMIYGPGMKGNPLRLFDLISSGLPLPLGALNCRRSRLYVENLAAAVVAALGNPSACTGTFFLGDAEELTTTEFVRRVARAFGTPERLLAVPPVLLQFAGRLGNLLSPLVQLPVTTEAMSSLSTPLQVDSAPFSRATGFVPPFSTDEALARTAAWYRAR